MATDQVFIYTMNNGVQNGRWSRYIFPWTIEYFSHLGNYLYMREGDNVHRAVESALNDNGVNFAGVIQWPWLDFGAPGVSKRLHGFDISGYGTGTIEFGYNQNNIAAFTATYPVPADSYPGQMIPYPLMAPSIAVKLTYTGGQAWQWNALSLYLQDQRVTA